MSTTYENIAYDRVLKGVETILETEFTDEAIVYLAPEYEEYPKRKSIRLWILSTEFILRMAGAVTNDFPVDITCHVPKGQRSDRVINDELMELTSKVKRVLDNNCAYSPAGVYKWHGGEVDIIPDPERTEDEPLPDVVSMSKLLYTVTVTEALA